MRINEKGKNRSEPGAAKKPPISTKLPPGVAIPGKKKQPVPGDEVPVRERARMEEGKKQSRADMRREQFKGEEYREEYRERYRDDYQEDYREDYREQYREQQRPQEQVKTGQPAMVLKDSYLSAKLRKQEEERRQNRRQKPTRGFGGLNDLMLENLWKEMEKQISYDVPQGKELPGDFLDSIGLSGEQVMISPRAVEALREILGGKKNV